MQNLILDTTTKFMVVVTSLFNLVISSFPGSVFCHVIDVHVWTWLLIYHDGSNNVHACLFVRSLSNGQSVPTYIYMYKPVNRQNQAVCFYGVVGNHLNRTFSNDVFLVPGFQCRCGGLFCSLHRYSDKHECSFDYKAEGQAEIRKNNPVVIRDKVQKI